VIGYDFAFGRGRTGNAQWLREHGYEVEVVPPFKIEGHDLHSSECAGLVIAATSAGEQAARPRYGLAGPVEAGSGWVGASVPTANIAVEPNKLIPALARMPVVPFDLEGRHDLDLVAVLAKPLCVSSAAAPEGEVIADHPATQSISAASRWMKSCGASDASSRSNLNTIAWSMRPPRLARAFPGGWLID